MVVDGARIPFLLREEMGISWSLVDRVADVTRDLIANELHLLSH